jgi:hypothetical protein
LLWFPRLPRGEFGDWRTRVECSLSRYVSDIKRSAPMDGRGGLQNGRLQLVSLTDEARKAGEDGALNAAQRLVAALAYCLLREPPGDQPYDEGAHERSKQL